MNRKLYSLEKLYLYKNKYITETSTNLYYLDHILNDTYFSLYIPISRNINCFIAKNNSGKSRCLRTILRPTPRDINNNYDIENINIISNILQSFLFIYNIFYMERDFDSHIVEISITLNNKFHTLNDIYNIHINMSLSIESLIKNYNNFTHNNTDELEFRYNYINNIIDSNPSLFSNIINEENSLQKEFLFIKNIQNLLDEWYEENIIKILGLFNKPIYIPILRGLRPLTSIDVYKERNIEDYYLYNVNIFTGFNLYSDIQNLLLGEFKDIQKLREFENFLSKEIFNNQLLSITAPKNKDVVYIKIGNAEERPIYSLGDGIQQFIILLFPFFNTKDEKDITICIEEPETHLHPKWQKIFIDTIATEFPNHHVFFTTHSNAFINHEAVDVYKVEKDFDENNEEITIISKIFEADKKSIILNLGCLPSDTLASNYNIWVEGPTDIPYIEKLIDLYSNGTLEKNKHYSFIILGGKTQFTNELQNFDLHNPNSSFAIILDSDAKNPLESYYLKIRDYFKSYWAKKQLKPSALYWIISFREIENLIPLDIWKKTIINVAKDDNTNITEESCIKRYYENNPHYNDRTNMEVEGNTISDKKRLANKCKEYLNNTTIITDSPELSYYIPLLCKSIADANNMDIFPKIDNRFLRRKEKAFKKSWRKLISHHRQSAKKFDNNSNIKGINIEKVKSSINNIAPNNLKNLTKDNLLELKDTIEKAQKVLDKAISGHQSKQPNKVVEGKIDEKLRP